MLPPERPAPKIVSPYDRPDDEFGYAVYSVVIKASISQQAAIQAVRQAVKHKRSMIPAHVTVKGTFCELPSLDTIIDRIQEIARQVAPLRVEFQLGDRNDESSSGIKRNGNDYAGQMIRRTDDLVALHDLLYEALSPITTNAYGREDGDNYKPHMAIYAEATPGLEQKADEMLANLDIGSGFDCDVLFLMGHIGPPYRGRWTVVREILLRG